MSFARVSSVVITTEPKIPNILGVILYTFHVLIDAPPTPQSFCGPVLPVPIADVEVSETTQKILGHGIEISLHTS